MDPGLTRRSLLGALSALPLAGPLVRPARADERVLKVIALGQAVVSRDLRDPPYPDFARVAALLHSVDGCAVDLIAAPAAPPSTPVPAGAAPLPARASDPGALDALKALGIGMLAIANGSSVDPSLSALADLAAAAHARELTIAGAGVDLAGANAAGYRTAANGKLALVAAASGEIRVGTAAGEGRPGINVIPRQPTGQLDALEIERVAAMVQAAAENADAAFVYLHHEGANADARQRIEWQQRVGRRAIESGAGLVVGTGAAQVQGIEIYRNRPIFYGLGNFVYQPPTRAGGGELGPEALQAIAARCTFGGDTLRQVELIPIQLTADASGAPGGSEDAQAASRGRPTLADAATSAAILTRVAELSRPHNTTLAVADGIGRIAL
jgi:poly-gamma-glutamate synthesis protein (capsule biosynthesis protein)